MNVEINATHLNMALSLCPVCNLGAIHAVLGEFLVRCCFSELGPPVSRLAETPLLLRKPCYRQCSRVTIQKYHQLKANFIKMFVIFSWKDEKNATYLFFHLSDAHSLCNRIKLSEPRDGSRAQNPQRFTRRH